MKKNLLAQINAGIILACNIFASKNNDQNIGIITDMDTKTSYYLKNNENNVNTEEDKTSKSILEKLGKQKVNYVYNNRRHYCENEKNCKNLSDLIRNLDQYYIEAYDYYIITEKNEIFSDQVYCEFTEGESLNKNKHIEIMIRKIKKVEEKKIWIYDDDANSCEYNSKINDFRIVLPHEERTNYENDIFTLIQKASKNDFSKSLNNKENKYISKYQIENGNIISLEDTSFNSIAEKTILNAILTGKTVKLYLKKRNKKMNIEIKNKYYLDRNIFTDDVLTKLDDYIENLNMGRHQKKNPETYDELLREISKIIGKEDAIKGIQISKKENKKYKNLKNNEKLNTNAYYIIKFRDDLYRAEINVKLKTKNGLDLIENTPIVKVTYYLYDFNEINDFVYLNIGDLIKTLNKMYKNLNLNNNDFTFKFENLDYKGEAPLNSTIRDKGLITIIRNKECDYKEQNKYNKNTNIRESINSYAKHNMLNKDTSKNTINCCISCPSRR